MSGDSGERVRPSAAGIGRNRPSVLLLSHGPSSAHAFAETLAALADLQVRSNSTAALNASLGDAAPDLLILDSFDDGADGARARLARLREDPRMALTPALLVLGPEDPPLEAEDRQLGVVDYIVRPLHPTILRRRVETALRLARIRAAQGSESLAAVGENRIPPQRADWALRAYVRSSKALTRMHGVEGVATQVCEAIVAEDTYALAFVGLLRGGGDVDYAAQAGAAVRYLDRLVLSAREDHTSGQGPTGIALRTGRPHFARDIQADPAFLPWRQRAAEHGLRSAVTVPIARDSGPVGVLMVYSRAPDAFGREELELFQRLADELSLAMRISEDRSRRVLAEAEYRRLFDNALEAIIIGDLQSGVLDVNPAFSALSGMPRDSVIGRPLMDLLEPEARDRARRALPRLLAGHEYEDEIEVRREDGARLQVAIRTGLQPNGRTLTFIRDISERRRAETEQSAIEAVRRVSDARYRSLFEHARDGILITDRHAVLIDVNPRVCAKLGLDREALIGRRFADLTSGLDWARLQPAFAALQPGFEINGEATLTDGDGVPFPVEFSTTAMDDGNLLTVGRDLSFRQAQEALRQKSDDLLRQTRAELARVVRVSALGEMAATIAHEINQPLAAVVANSNAAQRWLGHEPPNRHEVGAALERILRDSLRASEVIQRIRRFASRGDIEPAPFDLNAAIEDVIALTAGEQRSMDVAMDCDLSGDLPAALGDRLQVQQVVFNLFLNAFEALKGLDAARRRIRIESRREPGGLLRVSVRDWGPGLDPSPERDVFEPYFTTRTNGSGLGLALSRSIIEALGGRIWAEQPDGPGALFRFTLPAAIANLTVPPAT